MPSAVCAKSKQTMHVSYQKGCVWVRSGSHMRVPLQGRLVLLNVGAQFEPTKLHAPN